MKLYIFKSEVNNDLRAFAGDLMGSKLPEQFRPWHAIGVVGPENAPPHNFSREKIEEAIGACGFQLWRVKPSAKVA